MDSGATLGVETTGLLRAEEHRNEVKAGLWEGEGPVVEPSTIEVEELGGVRRSQPSIRNRNLCSNSVTFSAGLFLVRVGIFSASAPQRPRIHSCGDLQNPHLRVLTAAMLSRGSVR